MTPAVTDLSSEDFSFPRIDPRDPTGRKLHWVTSSEPHLLRRRELLAKHGSEIRKLYGYDHMTAWMVIGTTFAQFLFAYMSMSWSWPWVIALGWLLSGTLNQSLFTAQHEVSHFLAFRSPMLNRALAIFGNLPLVVPVAVKFREYHHDHHLFLGVDGGDVDLPTLWEVKHVTNRFTKVIFSFVYLCIYGARPLLVRPKPFSVPDLVNWLIVIPFDLAVLYFGGFKPLLYLLMGSLLGGGPHPLAGHLLAEHYMFEPGQETYSYYGPLNMLTYNVGYHNEHHDFPQIPHTRLHKLRALAPEYYSNLRAHTSWCWVLWRFLVDPSIGPWSRVHRLRREGDVASDAQFIASGCKAGPPLVPSKANGVNGKVNGCGAAAVDLCVGTPKSPIRARRSGRNSENEPPAN